MNDQSRSEGHESDTTRRARVVVADDHPIFRFGLRSLVERCGLELAAEATSLDMLDRELHLQTPDLLIFNTSLLGKAQPDGFTELVRRWSDAGVAILAMHEDPASVRQVMHGGVRGCVRNRVEIEEFSLAVNTVLAGGFYLDSKLGQHVLSGQNGAVESQYRLTRREQMVLGLIAEGLTNQQIARRLHLSLRTVEGHRAYIKKKTGLRDRSQLSAFARKYRLSPAPQLGAAS